MPGDIIRYDLRIQDALRGAIRQILAEIGKDGLPGEHHFYITFRTDRPGVKLSNALRERYPKEMTIVLQHHFWDLVVSEHQFQVGLSFSNVPEKLVIPFAAMTGFFDPSVNFMLQFEVDEREPAVKVEAEPPKLALADKRPKPPGAASEPTETQPKTPSVPSIRAVPKEAPAAPPPAEGDVKVVSLDAFRKKP